MIRRTEILKAFNITPLIRSVRSVRVILDTDLAKLYGVETRAVNQALKRNQERFPEDFAFELTREEILRISQAVTSLQKLRPLLEPPPTPPKPEIGFHVKEDAIPYRIKRK